MLAHEWPVKKYFPASVMFDRRVLLIEKNNLTMKQQVTAQAQKQSIRFNRTLYVLFLVIVIYQFATHDVESAVVNLGIALIFDPFDARVKWPDRPLYQRIWLMAHLALTLIGFLYLIFD
jgi:hypothetical protein